MRAPMLSLLCALLTGCLMRDDAGDQPSSRPLLTRVTFERNSALGYREHVEAAHRFARQVALLRGENRARPVMVECHTDPKGSPQFNDGLSARRARTMREILLNAGIDGARIRTASLGATKQGQVAGPRTLTGRDGDPPLTHNRYCDLFVP